MFSFGLKRPDFWSQPRKSIELLRRVSLPAVQRLVWGELLGCGRRGIMVRFRARWKGAPGASPLDGESRAASGAGNRAGSVRQEKGCCVRDGPAPPLACRDAGTQGMLPLCRSGTRLPGTRLPGTLASAEVGARSCSPVEATGKGRPHQPWFYLHPRAQPSSFGQVSFQIPELSHAVTSGC